MADVLGKVIRLTAGHQAKVEERSKDPVPTHALDEPSAPRKLSAVRSEPRPALTMIPKMVSVPDNPLKVTLMRLSNPTQARV